MFSEFQTKRFKNRGMVETSSLPSGWASCPDAVSVSLSMSSVAAGVRNIIDTIINEQLNSVKKN